MDSTDNIPDNASFGLILDRTSFYAESGGQEHDTGNIVIDGVADFEVTDVKVYNGYVLHVGHLKYGTLAIGNKVVSSYDEVRVKAICDIFSIAAAAAVAIAQQSHGDSYPQLLSARGTRGPYRSKGLAGCADETSV